MEGTRIAKYGDVIRDVRESLAELTDIEQVGVLHELIDDTPYKSQSYAKYLHDEYYIQHNKPDIISRSSKSYTLAVDDTTTGHLMDTIRGRHSVRDYANADVDFNVFSRVLHYSFGVKYFGRGAYGRREFPFKYTNTQGGLNYLDLYVVVNRVEGVDQGLYYYDFICDRICQMDRGNMRGLLGEINYQNEFCAYSNFVCFVVADMSRVVPKYYRRAYRFAHVDAGILTAYLQLIAEDNGLGSCAIAGYLEHKLEKVLELGADEYPLLAVSVGRKPQRA